MSAARRPSTSALLLIGALSCCGCGERTAAPQAAEPAPAAPAPWLLTLAPPAPGPTSGASPAAADAPAVDPVPDLPPGSRLVRLDPSLPGRLGALSVGLETAGRACVDADGAWVAFTGRASAGEPLCVYVCRPDGSERRVALRGPRDLLAPVWLPDGRLAALAALDRPGPLPGLPRAYGLVVGAADGGTPRAITFGAGTDLDPALLPDGRLVYAAFRPAAPGRAAGFALWAVHVDGTGADLFHDPGPSHAPGAPVYLRWPRTQPDGSVRYAAGPTLAALSPWRTDPRLPAAPARPDPAADDPVERGAPAGERVLHRVRLAPSARPQGHLSLVDLAKPAGQLVLLDARPPGVPGAARLRVRALPAAAGPGAQGRELGSVALAADGSAFLRVPADVPLLLDVLDAQGAPLLSTHTPLWVRPNESRGCVGCHEPRDQVPPNRRPLAVEAPAVDLLPAPPTEAAR